LYGEEYFASLPGKKLSIQSMGGQLGPGASVHVLDKRKKLLLLPGNKYRIG
jgi:hypothetical protein